MSVAVVLLDGSAGTVDPTGVFTSLPSGPPAGAHAFGCLTFRTPGTYALSMLYDAFICHASEDKADFVRPLAEQLRAQHVEVWYDEFSLKVGDSLRRSIDRGLSQSRFGIVVFSPDFFRKQWSQWELDGLVAGSSQSTV